jgi:hypothetical protein
MTHQDVSAGPLAFMLLAFIASACSADVVDLGGGELQSARGVRCTESVIVTEPVRVTSQVELEALRGCEQVDGDLTVEIFAGADLSPLASLRTVDGVLGIGAFPAPTDLHTLDSAQRAEQSRQVREVLDRGYLISLHGLEAVERVGGLSLYGVDTPDLSAFESLSSVSYSFTTISSGAVEIEAARYLTSLSGLENARDITILNLRGNTGLQSLAGLIVSDTLGAIGIENSPQLSDLSQLSAMTYVSVLSLTNVGVRNLDALESLNQVSDLELDSNPELENVDRISGLVTLEGLSISRNPKLTSIPALSYLGSGLSFVSIDANPELRGIALGLTPSATAYISRGRPTESSAGFFEITRNPKLETLALASGLEKADYLTVWRNSSLASIDFGTLRSLDTLALQDNPSLTTLVLGDLQTVDSLVVTDNPLLVTAPLRGLLSFEQSLSGNADDAPIKESKSAAPP